MSLEAEPLVTTTTKPSVVIKTIGVGSAGLNLLEQMAQDGVPLESLVAVHSDGQALARCRAAEKIQIEGKSRRGSAAAPANDGPLVLGEEPLGRLKDCCKDATITFVLGGLGGVLGTGLSPVLAGIARESGALVIAIMALPFECEGSLRMQVAETGLERLKEMADLVVEWPNQNTIALLAETTALHETFQTSNRLLSDTIRALWRAAMSEALIGLPFLDVMLLLRQQSPGCLVGFVEVSGPNRATEAVDRVLAHPMLQGHAALAPSDGSAAAFVQQPDTIGVWLMGGPSLTMTEVNRIIEQIQQRSAGAPLVMGAAIAPELGDRLLIGLLVARTKPMLGTTALDGSAAEAGEGTSEDLPVQLLDRAADARRHSRFVPPAPALPQEKMAQLLKQQGRGAGRARKAQSKLRQTQLPLEIVSKGRFDKSEPTIHKGEDLDVPTYIRRGVALN